jgi:hypothetical protein
VHSEQASGLVHGKLAIGSGFHVKMRYPGTTIIEKIKIGLKVPGGTDHLMRRLHLLTSAD